MSDLRAFRRTIVGLARAHVRQGRVPSVVVPTAGAARQLRRLAADARETPMLTRDGLYDALHTRLQPPPRRLTVHERDAMVQAALRHAGWTAVRGGFVAEALRFYDQLRRQNGSVARFEALLDDALSRDAEFDRGAARMLAETRALAEAFREYERRVEQAGACDEHTLRDRIIRQAASEPLRAVVVTVGDWIADPDGLYLADYDMLTRVPGLEALDVVATDTLLASGYHQRIHDWLPGIEECDEAAHGATDGADAGRPRLEVPPSGAGRLCFVYRDREEELMAVARALVDSSPSSPAAVVFRRPLPYLYLAPEVFGSAGLPFQAADALPLAAEPPAAALDLLLEAVESNFTRASLTALMRSPHFVFTDGGVPIEREAVAALDRGMSDERFLGGVEALRALEASWSRDSPPGALRAARRLAERLLPLADAAPASTQFGRLNELLLDLERPLDPADPTTPRLARGRSAIHDLLASLGDAHAQHDDRPMTIAELAPAVRRAIEAQTFGLETGDQGVHLVDEQAARYGEFERIALVGLIEGEWPDRPRRNIFYPPSLLASLGWPTEKDRRSAVEARFVELLTSAGDAVRVSTVTLDDEMLVEPSTLVDEIPRAGLTTVEAGGTLPALVFRDERLMREPAPIDGLDPEARAWLSMRTAQPAEEDGAFHGRVAPLDPRPWSVSALETYLGCPFRFFAQHVLRLREEPDDEEVMDPRTQGEFVHGVFEAFFREWQAAGRRAITPANLDDARALFRDVVEASLTRLSPTEASLERTRLLGSPAAAGLGEAVFRLEVERPVPVLERRLEHTLRGEFTIETTGGRRRLPLIGRADRLDLLADGTFRLIDYKLGWPPNRARALQLPIYAVCAEQSLDGHLGRQWTLGEAAYLAFKGPRRVVPVVGASTSDDERRRILVDAQDRLAATVDAIAAGFFPPTPDDVFRCGTCAYAAVCRLDYVGDV